MEPLRDVPGQRRAAGDEQPDPATEALPQLAEHHLVGANRPGGRFEREARAARSNPFDALTGTIDGPRLNRRRMQRTQEFQRIAMSVDRAIGPAGNVDAEAG